MSHASAKTVATVVFHIFLAGRAHLVVTDAMEGAIRRLSTPECQRVLTDFADPAGHRLSVNLETLGKTPVEYLAGLYFVEGGSFDQCRRDYVFAFTAPHNRVIYVCGARFADRFALQTAGGEILIIHELLHSLGLGENPPSSDQITDRVRVRCGG